MTTLLNVKCIFTVIKILNTSLLFILLMLVYSSVLLVDFLLILGWIMSSLSSCGANCCILVKKTGLNQVLKTQAPSLDAKKHKIDPKRHKLAFLDPKRYKLYPKRKKLALLDPKNTN